MQNAHDQMSTGRKLVLALTVYAGFFLLVEGAARVGGFFLYGRSPYFLFYGFDTWMADPDPKGHSVAMDGYFKFPSSQVLNQYGMFREPTPVRINTAGFRGPDFEPEKGSAVFRVVCLGGSSTFGFFGRDQYTYPFLLQQAFREGDIPGVRRVEVINAGIPHARSDNVLAMLRGEVLGYAPDVITLYTGYNDAVYVKDTNRLQELSRWLHGHFASYVALKRLISAVGGPEIHSRWTTHSESRAAQVLQQIELHVEDYEANLRGIIELAGEHGIDVILIRQAMNAFHYKNPQREAYEPVGYDDRTRMILEKLEAGQDVTGLEVKHVVHASLMGILGPVADEYPHVRFVDFVSEVGTRWDYLASPVHLTEEANARMAEVLRSRLLTGGSDLGDDRASATSSVADTLVTRSGEGSIQAPD